MNRVPASSIYRDYIGHVYVQPGTKNDHLAPYIELKPALLLEKLDLEELQQEHSISPLLGNEHPVTVVFQQACIRADVHRETLNLIAKSLNHVRQIFLPNEIPTLYFVCPPLTSNDRFLNFKHLKARWNQNKVYYHDQYQSTVNQLVQQVEIFLKIEKNRKIQQVGFSIFSLMTVSTIILGAALASKPVIVMGCGLVGLIGPIIWYMRKEKATQQKQILEIKNQLDRTFSALNTEALKLNLDSD